MSSDVDVNVTHGSAERCDAVSATRFFGVDAECARVVAVEKPLLDVAAVAPEALSLPGLVCSFFSLRHRVQNPTDGGN